MERDRPATVRAMLTIYFNSHAHVERDSSTPALMILWIISTHTLTWSVTKNIILFIFFLKISTHTLTWSVTLYKIN